MPNAVSVTVKDLANADKVFDVVSPSSGGAAAQYEQTAASSKKALRPSIDVVNRPVNGAPNSRKGLVTGVFPVVQTVAGVEQAQSYTFFKLESKTDSMVDDATLEDQFVRFANFVLNAGVRKSIANGQNMT